MGTCPRAHAYMPACPWVHACMPMRTCPHAHEYMPTYRRPNLTFFSKMTHVRGLARRRYIYFIRQMCEMPETYADVHGPTWPTHLFPQTCTPRLIFRSDLQSSRSTFDIFDRNCVNRPNAFFSSPLGVNRTLRIHFHTPDVDFCHFWPKCLEVPRRESRSEINYRK